MINWLTRFVSSRKGVMTARILIGVAIGMNLAIIAVQLDAPNVIRLAMTVALILFVIWDHGTTERREGFDEGVEYTLTKFEQAVRESGGTITATKIDSDGVATIITAEEPDQK